VFIDLLQPSIAFNSLTI